MNRRFYLGWFIFAVLAHGCASQPSRFVPRGQQELEPSLAVVVPYPPPPARLVTMSPRPKDERCQWLDGEWRFSAKGWQFIDGAWVVAPVGCVFATMHLEWRSSDAWPKGRLLWWSGRWIREPRSRTSQPAPCPPPTPCTAAEPTAPEPAAPEPTAPEPTAPEPAASTALPASTPSST